jgi:hypothetical protein
MPKGKRLTKSKGLVHGKVNSREAGVLEFTKQVATLLYDFSVDGGAIGTLSFKTSLPAKAVVTGVFADELTDITSGGSATVKVVAGSTDLTTATAIASFGGATALTLAASATAIKLASGGELKLTIATAALTAGKLLVAVEYFISK